VDFARDKIEIDIVVSDDGGKRLANSAQFHDRDRVRRSRMTGAENRADGRDIVSQYPRRLRLTNPI